MTTAGAGYDVIVLVTITPLQPNLVYLTLEIPVQFRLEPEEELAFTPFGGVVQCNIAALERSRLLD